MEGYTCILWFFLLIGSGCANVTLSTTYPSTSTTATSASAPASSVSPTATLSPSSTSTRSPTVTTPPPVDSPPNEAEPPLIPRSEVDVTRLYAELSAMKSTLQGVMGELERFQGLYMKTMDAKLTQVITTISAIDSNVKTLQDRAHVWDIFKHHIESWSDHMKSVDKKIDLIKRSQEMTFTVENKLSALELRSTHIFERVDLVNEKMHDMLKILYEQKGKKCGDQVDSISPRLTSIEKQITMIQNNHCKAQPRRGKSGNSEPFVTTLSQAITAEPSSSSTFTSSKEFKQLLATNKKALNTLEYVSETVTSMNTTTNRLHKSLGTCCRNSEVRVTMLKDSVDAAFQKLERIYLNLEDSIMQKKNVLVAEKNTTKRIELEDPTTEQSEEDLDGSGSGSGDHELRERRVDEGKRRKEKENKAPFRSNCHELKALEDGIYSFGLADDVNEVGRKFNYRYCHFDPDGSAGWTVVQRRGPFLPRESFNRSWADYKNGFGELDKEFWYGNDFIHQLTNEDGQMSLRIVLQDFKGNYGVVQYSRFYMSSERSFYRLDIQGFSGNISDSLLYHNQMYFSTYDSSNDHSGDIPCALSHGSGWWWNNCLESNLNGKYSRDPLNTHYTGIIWEQWLGDYSLKATTMMIRPVGPVRGLWIDEDEADEVDDGPMSPPEDP